MPQHGYLTLLSTDGFAQNWACAADLEAIQALYHAFTRAGFPAGRRSSQAAGSTQCTYRRTQPDVPRSHPPAHARALLTAKIFVEDIQPLYAQSPAQVRPPTCTKGTERRRRRGGRRQVGHGSCQGSFPPGADLPFCRITPCLRPAFGVRRRTEAIRTHWNMPEQTCWAICCRPPEPPSGDTRASSGWPVQRFTKGLSPRIEVRQKDGAVRAPSPGCFVPFAGRQRQLTEPPGRLRSIGAKTRKKVRGLRRADGEEADRGCTPAASRRARPRLPRRRRHLAG